MPTVTEISDQRRAANRRNIYLDGAFAFGCNVNVVARFRLRVGLELSAEQVVQIRDGEVRQECFDRAVRSLETRLHGRAELKKKLARKQQWPDAVIESVLDDLTRMGYLDDAKFAVERATSAAKHKHHGRRRAGLELARKGIAPADAGKALEKVYETHDSLAVATELAMKQAPRLGRLDPAVARRRLVGMLLRRGFDFDTIRPAVERALGHADDLPAD